MKKILKSFFRSIGVDLIRYLPSVSSTAQLQKIFKNQSFDFVVDVGANKGSYCLRLREIGYNGHIIVFEPLSSAYQDLKRIANQDKKIVLPPRMAIGDCDGEIKLNVASNSESSSLLPMLNSHLEAAPESVYIGTENVIIHRLDTILIDYLPAASKSVYLKIDTQGYEQRILEGAAGVLPFIKGIQLELSMVSLYDDQVIIADMINYIQRLGFTMYALQPAFTDNRTGRTYQVDGIFIRTDALL